jgi:hypothetical protein
LVLGLAVVTFAIAGLAVDGSRAFLFRRSLQSSADAAAIGAAGELDGSRYYASGGRTVVLETAMARRQVLTLLRARGLPARAAIAVDPRGVTVVLRGRVATTFLGAVGIDSIPVAVEARARPVPGSPN